MKIQVLGSGCVTCKKLFEITQKAVTEMKIEVEVEYITGNLGTQKIIELGVLSSPVLVVNDKIALTGFTPSVEKIKEKIKAVLEEK